MGTDDVDYDALADWAENVAPDLPVSPGALRGEDAARAGRAALERATYGYELTDDERTYFASPGMVAAVERSDKHPEARREYVRRTPRRNRPE